MPKLTMSFDSEIDFVRACEYFEETNYDYEIDNQNRKLLFTCKQLNGGQLFKDRIETEILYKSFEFESFNID
jgi:hypothetical protein